MAEKRKKICLIGSTKFKAAYLEWNARLTLAGNIVTSVSMFSHRMRVKPTDEQKEVLDAVHLSKIDECDEVFVIDVGGYIGSSTRNEIAYATSTNKPVLYLSREHPDWTEADCQYAADAFAQQEIDRLRSLVSAAGFDPDTATEDDLAAIVQERDSIAAKIDDLKTRVDDLEEVGDEHEKALLCLERIGNIVDCDHYDDRLVDHVKKTFAASEKMIDDLNSSFNVARVQALEAERDALVSRVGALVDAAAPFVRADAVTLRVPDSFPALSSDCLWGDVRKLARVVRQAGR
jgi:hypothetical protein